MKLFRICLAVLAAIALRVDAADLYRSGDGTWDTSTANWGTAFGGPYSGSTWNNSTPDNAFVTGVNGSHTITLGTSITVSNLTFYDNTAADGPQPDSRDYVVQGGTLNFVTNGEIRAHFTDNTRSGSSLIISSAITGRPWCGVGDNQHIIEFAPTSGSQELGTCMIPFENGVWDKAVIKLGGSTTGNSATEIIYQTSPDNHWGSIIKEGSSTWTVHGDMRNGSLTISGGTLIANGWIRMYYSGFSLSAGKLVGECTIFRNDVRGKVIAQNGFTIAPGNNGVGTMTVDWGSGSPTADQMWMQFADGSIYEWEVGEAATDVMHCVDGKLDLDNFVLKIFDAGGAPKDSDQLPVFTYDGGVTVDMSGFSNTVSNFDTSEVTTWAGGELSLQDDGSGTIYLTGLNKPPAGMVLILR